MTYVTALLPVAKGVGVYAALNKTVEVMQPRPLDPLPRNMTFDLAPPAPQLGMRAAQIALDAVGSRLRRAPWRN